eukprot:gene19164-9863_t
MPSTTRLENTEAQTPMKARWGAPLGGGSWADRIAMRLQPRKNGVTESFRAEGQLWQLRRHHPDHIALNLPDDNNGTLITPIFRGHFQNWLNKVLGACNDAEHFDRSSAPGLLSCTLDGGGKIVSFDSAEVEVVAETANSTRLCRQANFNFTSSLPMAATVALGSGQ